LGDTFSLGIDVVVKANMPAFSVHGYLIRIILAGDRLLTGHFGWVNLAHATAR
jgi:hypothetical protein